MKHLFNMFKDWLALLIYFYPRGTCLSSLILWITDISGKEYANSLSSHHNCQPVFCLLVPVNQFQRLPLIHQSRRYLVFHLNSLPYLFLLSNTSCGCRDKMYRLQGNIGFIQYIQSPQSLPYIHTIHYGLTYSWRHEPNISQTINK